MISSLGPVSLAGSDVWFVEALPTEGLLTPLLLLITDELLAAIAADDPFSINFDSSDLSDCDDCIPPPTKQIEYLR